jgi:hypothetical protein
VALAYAKPARAAACGGVGERAAEGWRSLAPRSPRAAAVRVSGDDRVAGDCRSRTRSPLAWRHARATASE